MKDLCNFVPFVEAFFEIGGGRMDQIRKYALLGPEDDMFFSPRLLEVMKHQDLEGMDIDVIRRSGKSYIDLAEILVPVAGNSL